MRQLLVLSGKGGTGKTTVAASFIAMAGYGTSDPQTLPSSPRLESQNRPTLHETVNLMACADCDVDAPNMHCVLGGLVSGPSCVRTSELAGELTGELMMGGLAEEPPATHPSSLPSELCSGFSGVGKEPFFGLDVAFIHGNMCDGCGLCREHCRFGAIVAGQADSTDRSDAPLKTILTKAIPKVTALEVKSWACEGCGVCEAICPQGAITMVQDQAGEMALYKNETSVFSTARLKMGKGNSGLLVTQVKKRMQTNALPGTSLAIIDGSPGIGCPVIASLNGVDMVLLVVEPTLSGISDMERIVVVAKSFAVPMAVCINRFMRHDKNTERIEHFCREEGLSFVGIIPYDPQVVRAINNGCSVMAFDCPASRSLREVFVNTMGIIDKQEKKLC